MTPLYHVEQVSKRYHAATWRWPWIAGDTHGRQALTEVDLHIDAGEILGLVGESGCGKSTLARIMLGLTPPTSGRLSFCGQPFLASGRARDRRAALQVQMIFQDPAASLNPRLRIRDAIVEAPLAHGLIAAREGDAYACALMEQVGLDPASRFAYPHQFSGGQKQRIAIARALAVRPTLLVCDEAVASLDVSIQAQVLNLLMDLRHALRLSYLFISHDLGVVRHIADRVAVMYLGRIVELGPAQQVFAEPCHPYTRQLAAHLPSLARRTWVSRSNAGEPSTTSRLPSGCVYHPRCPDAVARCRVEVPRLRADANGRSVACHRHGER